MSKTLSFIVSSSLVLQLAPVVAFAAFHEALKEKRDTARQEIQEKRDALKQDVQQKRDTLKAEVKQRTEAVQGELKNKRDEAKERLEVLRNDAKAKRETLRQDVEKRKQEFKQEAEKRREELKKKLGEKRAENIEKFFNNMVGKFEAAIERLNDFADKVGERLDQAEVNGRDVKAARDKLGTAKGKIKEAGEALVAAKAKYSEAVQDPDFRASFQKVKEVVNSVASKVKDAHRALVDAVNSVKGLGGGERATTTPPTQ